MVHFFDICIEEAKRSYQHDDVPVGAIIVKDNEIIAKSHNTRQKNNDILGHAEINVIKKAAKALNRWNLSDCELYVTLKPCSMCLEVIKQAKICKVFYLLDKLDYKKEFNKCKMCKVNVNQEGNIEQMYSEMLSDFFKEKRRKNML